MHLFSKQDPEDGNASLLEQGRLAAADLRETLGHAAEHAGALAALFGVELREYKERQSKRLLALAIAGVLALVSYLAFCALACALIANHLGLEWGLAAVCLVNLLAAGILLLTAINRKPVPLAPATRKELQNDLQCLQILLKDKSKSC